MTDRIRITIAGKRESGKSNLFQLITAVLEEAGYTKTALLPIPELGREDRALVADDRTIITVETEEVENG